MDSSSQLYDLRLNPDGKAFTFTLQSNALIGGELRVGHPQPDRMTLDGSYDGHQISAIMSRNDLSDPQKFMLLNRGIHWINPYPFRW